MPVQVAVEPFTYTTSTADCGVRYFKAVVSGPGVPATCPSPPPTTALTLNVECPTADLAGGQIICQSANLTPIQVAVGPAGLNFQVDYTINGQPQPQLIGNAPSLTIPFNQTAPGTYIIQLTRVRGTRCIGMANGTYTVTINAPTPVALQPATICASQQPFDLSQLLVNPSVAGIWTGTGTTGSPGQFNAGPAAAGPYTVTFTPAISPSCLGPNSTTVTVSAPQIVALLPPPTVCPGTSLSLATLLPSGAPGGVWTASTPAVFTAPNTFTAPASGAAASYTFTYTPSTGCFQPSQVTVPVGSGTPVQLTAPPPVCANNLPYNLTQLEPSGQTGGTWSGTAVTGNMLAPSGTPATSYTVQYTPPASAGACAQPGSVTISITLPQNLALLAPPTVCPGTSLSLATLLPSGAPVASGQPPHPLSLRHPTPSPLPPRALPLATPLPTRPAPAASSQVR